MKSVGQYIKERREALGLSTADLARTLGITSAAISNWELQPTRSPSKDHLQKLADVLQVRVEDLLLPPQATKNTEEDDLVAAFRSLTDDERKFVLRIIRGLSPRR